MTTRDLFARHNLRCTTQRRALYETLCDQPDHPTAEELFRLVRPHIARLSLATVYNTLEALCRAGLARRLPTGNSCCRYDADTTEHLHLCFRESDEIQDVPGELSDRMMTHLRRSVIGEIERELGVQIEGLSIQLLASRTRQRAGAF